MCVQLCSITITRGEKITFDILMAYNGDQQTFSLKESGSKYFKLFGLHVFSVPIYFVFLYSS